jgi:D-alanine-D-alanine ligase
MKVTVLFGGPGAEREISLISGKAVIDGLRSMGYEVFASDVSRENLSGLDHPADVIFPVLHGEFGESGELQTRSKPNARGNGPGCRLPCTA